MGFGIKMIRLTVAGCLVFLLAACAGTNAAIGDGMAAMPERLGGEPADVPPRPGSSAYQAWLADHPQHGSASNSQAGNGSHPDWIGH